MKRSTFISMALLAPLAIALAWAFSIGSELRADIPPVEAFAEKLVYVEATERVAYTLENAEIRQVGSRAFIVRRESDESTTIGSRIKWGGALVWIPVDAVTQMIEIPVNNR